MRETYFIGYEQVTGRLGDCSGSFTISNTASPGKVSLQAIGQTSGLHISASVFAISLPIALSPTSGPAGTKVTITGSHFTPSGQVAINWNNFSRPGSNYTLTKVTATSTGTISVVVTAPFCESQQGGTICAFQARLSRNMVYVDGNPNPANIGYPNGLSILQILANR